MTFQVRKVIYGGCWWVDGGPQEYRVCPSPIQTLDLGLGIDLDQIWEFGHGN